jgi:predicted enzyme related to lactoylglutathione lyase
MVFTSYAPGTPCWVDLTTGDAGAAKSFYAELFDWTWQDMPAGEGRIYSMAYKDGKTVAGLGELSPEEKAQGLPPHWTTYIAVEDADAAATAARAAGGTVLVPPMDVFDSGRMAVVQDPTGAVFAVWRAGTHIGSGLANEPGSFSWNELQTHDTARAQRFYGEAFGWRPETTDTAGGPYTSFYVGDSPVAGMMAIQPEWGEVPPNWSIYMEVADCDAATKKVTELGGAVEFPPRSMGEIGRFALVRDPQGTYLYLYERAPGM